MADPPADDAAIIKDSRERPEVFARLYDRHAADIHRYVARRLGDGMADDPELARIRWFYPSDGGGEPSGDTLRESRDAHHYRAAGVLIKSYPMAHQGLARLYRALATVDGVEVVDHLVKDAAGRDAIG
ncbi:hypothetical protein [Streptomyces radiopugnans]|uniref:Uncharacterized protein n=1 Tax=Streptomyces radiopugnans TaxID=403935 RepID=A0A1H9A4H8_9ACTN|nr:hypothetical protein SAMN05216481_101870 [Streptomyces radiopugnans]